MTIMSSRLSEQIRKRKMKKEPQSRSRNLELKETETNSIWKWARQNDIENKLRLLKKDIAIQGEIVGPGINKNTLNLKYINIYFYDAFDITTFKYYNLNDFKILVENKLKLKTVPIISYDFDLIDNIDEFVKMSIGNSKINLEGMREGIVVRPLKEIYDCTVIEDNNGRISLKVINPEYLIKNE
jgi:RNA ligase (TIGR02306 family)